MARIDFNRSPNWLALRSLEVIRQNQAPSGAYIASPGFPTYHYAWFRDGAFCAYAMNLAGEHASARRFHHWAAGVVSARRDRVAQAVEKAQRGEPLREGDILHTRFTLEGDEAPTQEREGEWPNFQLDGFGTWLWALEQHLRLAQQPLPDSWRQAAQLAARYLSALWQRPCYDCWEEFPDQVHTHTLAAIFGGLQAYAGLSGEDNGAALAALRSWVFDRCLSENGYFVKFPGSQQVDASLVGLATPYRLVQPDDPRFLATLERIERMLVSGGGVHRYPSDSYYGGGEWLLLAGWLGWAWVEAGRPERARELLAWMESQAGEDGALPEQAAASLIHPDYLEMWERRWGPSANPLLWSHAKHLILRKFLYR
jgi:GH15 family glucan-1,4-alpha-glucosidase